MAKFGIAGDTSGVITVQGPSVAGTNTLTWPAETGTAITSAYTGAALPGQIAWNTTVQTTGFTAVAYGGYFCNTTGGAFTVTLPATPTRGQFVVIVDYAGTAATNNITISPNGGKINGGTSNKLLQTNRQGITFTYIDSTQGWLSTSNVYGGNPPFINAPYTGTYLLVAGGGGGGAGGPSWDPGGGGAGGYLTGSITISVGTVYSVSVGAGGARYTNGSPTTFTGLTTAVGGGSGGTGGGAPGNTGAPGGSGGGGAGQNSPNAGGSGTAGQGSAGGAGAAGPPSFAGGGGGGAGAVGSSGPTTAGAPGGNGLANSITGTPTYYAGGGGGNSDRTPAGTGGLGGGGTGVVGSGAAGNGTANTGGGGGASYGTNLSGNGGSGVVILSVPTANYSGTYTGTATVTTNGSNTIITWTSGSGTYTG